MFFPACLTGVSLGGLAVVLSIMLVVCLGMLGMLLETLLPKELSRWLLGPPDTRTRPGEQMVPNQQPQSPAVTSSQSSGQVAPNRQPQSATTSGTQLHQQTVSSRPPQAQQVASTVHSPAPAVHQSFTVPDVADQPLILALFLSHREFIQQQAGILAAIQRQRESRPGSTPPGTRGADSSAAGASAASAVPLSMPMADRTSTSGSKTAAESESQLEDVCVVCMDASKDWLCMPCRHLAMCGACTARIQHQTGRCPICQQYIRQAVQVYKA